MKVHELKSWPAEFAAVAEGRKTFEIRKDDRGFEPGDIVVLREYLPGESMTGRSCGPFRIDYVERSACIPEGWCGFSLRALAFNSEMVQP